MRNRIVPASLQHEMGRRAIGDEWATALRDFESYQRAGQTAAGTVELRRYHLRRMASSGPPGKSPWAWTLPDILGFLGQHRWQPNTRRSYRASIRAFYTWATLAEHVTRNPAALLPKIRVPQPVPRPAPEHVLIEAVRQAEARTRLMVQLAAYSGLRRAEVAKVHSDDLFTLSDGPWLRVHGKGGKTRIVPLTGVMAGTIRRDGHGHIFPSPNGGPLTPAHVGKLVSQALGERWTMHTLRHRFASVGYAGNSDIRAMQTLLGHARSETTEIYTAVPDGSMRRTVNAAA